MAIVLPHGVLFRGAAEGKIRQTIIEMCIRDRYFVQQLIYNTFSSGLEAKMPKDMGHLILRIRGR